MHIIVTDKKRRVIVSVRLPKHLSILKIISINAARKQDTKKPVIAVKKKIPTQVRTYDILLFIPTSFKRKVNIADIIARCIPLNARMWVTPSLVKSLFTLGSSPFVFPKSKADKSEAVSLLKPL